METNNLYRVDDTETGNFIIYTGSDLEEAKEAILSDDSPEIWDLMKDGTRIWCGKTDTIKELETL